MTPQEILRDWPAHGALWLMEDPQLFARHQGAFILAIQKARKEDCELLWDILRQQQATHLHHFVATSKSASSEMLEFARAHARADTHEGFTTLLGIAVNPNASASTLEQISHYDSDEAVVFNVILNPSTSLETLERISRGHSIEGATQWASNRLQIRDKMQFLTVQPLNDCN